jgi:lipopolysaccharide/colanic/teichoic acid biosynthesis glycosyltransferase
MTVRRDSERGIFDPGDKSRYTRTGRFLRATKLDEFPQFWNVLAGDMSVVGPRPEVRQWVNVYPERWKTVLSVKPGITDPASIEFRNEETILANSKDPVQTYRDIILPRKLDLYERYVARNSLMGDIGIVLKTFLALFRSNDSSWLAETATKRCGEYRD